MKQNDAPRSEYYVDAFRGELTEVWGHTRFAGEIDHLALSRAIACSIKRSPANVKRSRRLLYHYLSEFNGESERSLINVLYKQLPTGNFVGKYLNNVATLYKWAPRRQFGEGEAQSKAFSEIYDHFRLNRHFRRAHVLARALNVVAVRPVVRDSRLELEILTPDLFRVEVDPESPRTATAIWYPWVKVGADGKRVPMLRRMTAEAIEDYHPHNMRAPVATEPNAWRELHWVFLRLDDAEDFFGGGDDELLEQRMEANGLRFYANLSAKYEGHGVAIATNLQSEEDEADGEELTLGPGSVIERNGVGEQTGEDPPSLQFVSQAGQYSEIDELRRSRQHEMLRGKGVPNSNLVENPGQPASGAARRIERMELDDVREQDAEALALAEQQLKRKIAIAVNEAPVVIDGRSITGLPVDDVLTVEFQRERIVMEPKDELEHLVALVEKDVLPATELLREFGNHPDTLTEDEAVAIIRKHRALRRRAAADTDEAPAPASANALRESVGGSAQILEMQRAYYAGELPRAAVVANARVMFGFSNEEAEELFAELAPDAPKPEPAPTAVEPAGAIGGAPGPESEGEGENGPPAPAIAAENEE